MSIKKGLGRGLEALLSKENNEVLDPVKELDIIEIDILKIKPNKNQPRKYFNEDSLQELSESIKNFGVLQPILVTKNEDYYTIIAGERRFRAAKISKLKKIPCIVKSYSELEILEIAIIENIQRVDLNPMEEALCYQKLIEVFFYKKDDIAKKIGKSRNTIANTVNLLSLDQKVQELIILNNIPIGHTKELLTVEDPDMQLKIINKIIESDLSIKDAKKLIEIYLNAKNDKEIELKKVTIIKTNFKKIESSLKDILGTKVNIKGEDNKGKIEIEYYSEEELKRLIYLFKNNITNNKEELT